MVMLVASSRAFSSPACRCHSGRCQVDEKTSFGSNAVRNRWLVQGQWLEKGPFRPKSSEIREVFVAHAPHLGHLRCICVRLCVAHHTSRCKSATLVPFMGVGDSNLQVASPSSSGSSSISNSISSSSSSSSSSSVSVCLSVCLRVLRVVDRRRGTVSAFVGVWARAALFWKLQNV